MSWVLFSLISAVAVSAENILNKSIVRRQDPLLFTSVVSVLSGIITLPFLWVMDWSSLTLFNFVWLMLVAAVTSLAFVAAVAANKHLEISVSSPMFTLTPAAAAILGVIFLNERLNGGQIAGIVLLIVAGYALQLERGHSWLYPLQRMWQRRGYHLLFWAIVLYPVGAVMVRYSFTDLGMEPYPLFVAIKVIAAVYFAIYLVRRKEGLQVMPEQMLKHKGNYFWVVVLSMINAATIILALAGAYAALAVAVKRLSAIFTTIIGGEIFHERHLIQKSFACVIMVTGAMWVVLG
jgi:drug/metabolite transporter (DMT)-like permease